MKYSITDDHKLWQGKQKWCINFIYGHIVYFMGKYILHLAVNPDYSVQAEAVHVHVLFIKHWLCHPLHIFSPHKK
jgi:hypothetical protein